MNITYEIENFDSRQGNIDPIKDDFKLIILCNNEKIGYLYCYHEFGKIWAFESFIQEEYRRQGFGTRMYNYAMEISERTLFPHHENPYNNYPDDVSLDAISFWEKRRK